VLCRPGPLPLFVCSDGGTLLDLLLEEDGLAAATVAFLERAGVPVID
jgi:hypothetical protein